MTRINLASGAIALLLGTAALVHALFNFTSNLVFAMSINLALLLFGIFLVTAIAVVIANLITDILYAALDPRVRSSYGTNA